MTKHAKDILFQRNQDPFNRKWETWCQEWWQWLCGIPSEEGNPALDKDGTFAENHNPQTRDNDEVWFLAGAYKGKANHRKCKIPANSGILLPIAIDEQSTIERDVEVKGLRPNNNVLSDLCEEDANNVISLSLTIDEGTNDETIFYTGELCKYRVPTPVFDLTFCKNNIFELKSGPSKAVSDGYWAFFKPTFLANKNEKHTIHLQGIEDDYMTEAAYKITVI
jgi:hypothetical protein